MKNVLSFKGLAVDIPVSAVEFIDQLFSLLRHHDSETLMHCVRVGEMALALSKALSLDAHQQSICYYSGILHDIGKLKVPTAIINKPTKLNEEEYNIMKMHAEYGVELIAPLTKHSFFKEVSEAILYHHERVDGKGYHQIIESEIPLASKVILVVDTVDAMMEDRAYRKGLPWEVVEEELIRCAGTQFDASMVDCFLQGVADNTIALLANTDRKAS